METLHLIPHPACPPARVRAITARVLSHDRRWCVLRWKVAGTAGLVVPAFAGQGRQDGLWQTTCFELFVQPDWEGRVGVCEAAGMDQPADAANPCPSPDPWGGAYCEFNFSPSERWAAYDFAGYRSGMVPRAMARAPVITPRRGGDVLFCDVAIAAATLPPLPWRYGLTAVVEEAGGVKSYWALAHAGERPDFHDPACLGARLAAPEIA